jgi:predicted nuclease of predicted toxin-antitoxin system
MSSRASHLLRGIPKRSVFVITGNIRSQQLIPLFIRDLPVFEAAFERGDPVLFGLNGVDVQA